MRDSELLEIELDPAGLFLSRVEIDGNQNAVAATGFAVAEDVWVIYWMKVERAVAVEGRIAAPDLVDLGDERSEAVAGGTIPMADLIFFTVEILFAAELDGEIFAEFEGRAVDAVDRAQRCGEDETLHEGWAATGL